MRLLVAELLLWAAVSAALQSESQSKSTATRIEERREEMRRDLAMKRRGGLNEMAEWLLASSPDLQEGEISHRQVLDGLMFLATAQKGLKTVDGVSHQVSSALGKSNAQPFRELLTSVRSAPASELNLKKAARLRRNAALLREAFEAAEVMDAMEQLNPHSRRKRLKQAGLKVLSAQTKQLGKVPISKLISIQVAEDHRGVEEATSGIIIGVGEVCSGEKLLSALQEDPIPLRVRSGPRGRWRVAHVNPETFLQALVAFREIWETLKVHAIDDEVLNPTTVPEDTKEPEPEPKSRRAIRCVGHSLGGAVAALLAAFLGERMVLQQEAARDAVEDLLKPRMKGPASLRASMAKKWAEELLAPLEEYFALLETSNPFRVRAVTFGCPPIVSSTAGGPQGVDIVTSFVNGDDMLPRSSPSSLYRFKRRLLKAMPKGEGVVARGLALSSWIGFGLISDAARTAKQNLGELATGGVKRAPAQSYRRSPGRAQKRDEGLEAGDTSIVTMVVPGRLVFIKPRLAKNGATLSLLKVKNTAS